MAIEYAKHEIRATSRRGLPMALEQHLKRTGQTLEQWEARQSPEDVTGEALRLHARYLRLKHH